LEPHGGQGGLHISGKWGLKLQVLAGEGVGEAQTVSMQGLSLYLGTVAAAIQAVAQQWQANGRHVHPDLVGATGVQGPMHHTALVVAVQAFKAGVSWFARLAGQVHHSHAQAVARVAPHGQFNLTRFVATPGAL
jgi:hypothetical protein